MLLKILASTFINIKDFCKKYNTFKNSKNDTIAIVENNELILYLISPNRLSNLLDIEATFLKKQSKILNKKEESNNFMKFKMYKNWNPGNNFSQLAKLWGINLNYDVTQEELIFFIHYWEVENCIFYHIQWQQKLARSIQMNRKNHNIKDTRLKLNNKKNYIPYGFRG